MAGWESIISECNFDIIKMKGKFQDISTLSKQHIFRSVNTNGDKFNWLKLKWLRISSDSNGIMEYKESCAEDEPVKYIDFSGRNVEEEVHDIPPLYEVPPQISQEKFKDIQSLLQYVPPVYHSFYENLPHKSNSSVEMENIDELF